MRTSSLAATSAPSAATLLAEKPFTLEQVLSNPFPESLVAAPAGGSVAWQMNARGARNVWVASPPDYRGHAGYPLHRRRRPGHQPIALDARRPVDRLRSRRRLRHGARSSEPAQQSGGSRTGAVGSFRSTAAIHAKSAKAMTPAISPKGDRVAFLSKGQIWWAPLDGHDKAEQAVHARGTAQSLRWSPDGTKLAFVSSRGDHAFVGVFDPAAKSLRYLDPGVDQDSEPVWSPDSRQIAFIRVPASHDHLRVRASGSQRKPWSIRVADVATGAVSKSGKRRLDAAACSIRSWREKQLMWANGRLVFPWERTGWLHLYSVPVAGGAALDLTPGRVRSRARHPQSERPRRRVFLQSGRHRSPPYLESRGRSGRANAGDAGATGIEWSPVVTSDGEAIAFLRSDAQQPAPRGHHRRRRRTERSRTRAHSGGLSREQARRSAARHHLRRRRHAHPRPAVSAPRSRAGERRPALIFFHGGSRRQMLLGWHYMYYYNNAYAMNQYLASRGFIVLSVNYRSGIGYGLDFREAAELRRARRKRIQRRRGRRPLSAQPAGCRSRRASACGAARTAAISRRSASRAPPICSRPASISTASTTGTSVIRNFVPAYDPQKHAGSRAHRVRVLAHGGGQAPGARRCC